MGIKVEVEGLDSLEEKLSPTQLRARVRIGLIRGLIRTQATTIRKLSGPVLKNQTGTLRRSIHYRVEDTDTSVDGMIGSFAGYPNPKGGQEAAGYARIHEYGGTFQVPAHTRRIGYNKDSERIALLTKAGGIRKAVDNYSEVNVKAHTVTYPERSFLRSSVRDEKPNIVLELRNALLGRT